MQGPDLEDLELQGIVPRMVRTIFNRIDNSNENIEYTVKVSMCEIYMEKIKDLLDSTKVNMQIKQDKQRGIFIKDITERYIASEEEVYDIMRVGNDNRMVAATRMNDQSSRSHSIFMMTVSQNNVDEGSCKQGHLFLIDLAGSEKVGKTGASGQTLNEAKGINQSLSALGKVIKALTEQKKGGGFIPYRESKLTRLLSESLGGNSKTALIITCSPSPYNVMESISTLRFGTTARNIKNTPKINRELTATEMKRLIAKSKKQLEIQSYRITVLTKHITENNLDVPEDEFKDQIELIKPSPEKPEAIVEEIKEDSSPVPQPTEEEEEEKLDFEVIEEDTDTPERKEQSAAEDSESAELLS